MDILGTVFIACFVALLLFTAITFGFAIITACLVITVIATVIIALREAWRRWQFLHSADQAPPPRIIDGEYREILHKDGEES